MDNLGVVDLSAGVLRACRSKLCRRSDTWSRVNPLDGSGQDSDGEDERRCDWIGGSCSAQSVFGAPTF